MAELQEVLIYGGGMLGKQVGHLLTRYHSGQYALRGYIDDVREAGSEVLDGVSTVGSLDEVSEQSEFAPGTMPVIFAIGYSDMVARRQAFEKIEALGYELPGLVHPRASVEPTAKLGRAVIILAGAVIDQYVALGDACYVHNGAVVGENSVLGSNNYLSAGCTFGGSVAVGEDNFFGINATIVNDIHIGNNNFVNAASLVYKNVGDNVNVVEFREQREVGRPPK